MTAPDLNADAILACADLVGRAGASSFDIGYTGDETSPRWYAQAHYRGTRIMVQDRHTPTEAAQGLAERLLRGGTCRCGKPVSLSDRPGCRWRLVGARWEPGCDAPSVRTPGKRGDLGAMERALRAATGGD